MEGKWKIIIPFILLLGVVALLGGTMAITLGEFGETMDVCLNTSGYILNDQGTACVNSSFVVEEAGCCGQDGQNITDQYFTKVQGIGGVKTVAEQQNTLAIIVVMVIIISVIMTIVAVVGMNRR